MSTHNDGDNNKLAVTAILLTAFSLSLGDTIIKWISADAESSLWQIFIIRSAIAIPILFLIIKTRYRSTSLKPDHMTWTIIRSFVLVITWGAYYIALPHIEFSVAAAAFYTCPVFITLFAALFIGDKIGAKGWIAVLLGFCGVLMMLRPQTDDFNVYMLLPIISAILYALAMIITRTKCKEENVLVLSLGFNLSMFIIGTLGALVIWKLSPSIVETENSLFLLGQWSSMGMNEWFAMILMSTAAIIGSIGTAVAYQSGPSAIVATFDFSYIGFAAGFGLLFFGEVPDPINVIGIILIVSGGLLAVRR